MIVVTTRNATGLRACLKGIQRERAHLSLETIIVLNSATDDVRAVATSDTMITIVESGISLGFAGGTNLGAEHAHGDYLLLLHDDAEGEPAWMSTLVSCADAHPRAGAIGSLLLNPDGGLQSAGSILWRDGTTSPAWSSDLSSLARLTEPFPVDYCSSASLLVRADTWHAIGGADERFYPAYYIDVDLAMMIREVGEVVLCEPRSRVRHAYRDRDDLDFRAFAAERNRKRFLDKWSKALEIQLPRQLESASLELARSHAVSQAERLKASESAGATQPDPAQPPLASEQLQRERRHLAQEAELKDAWSNELARKHRELGVELAAARESSLEIASQREQLVQELNTVRSELDALRAELVSTRQQLDARAETIMNLERDREAWRQRELGLQAERAQREEQLAWLHEREAMLQRIESGGWWRLRRHVLPLINFSQWLRRPWARR